MGQKNSQHLTHTWIVKMVQKPWYITQKGIQREEDEKRKREKKERLKKYNKKKERTLIY